MRITPLSHAHPGVLIAVEGVDGSGKSKACELLKEALQQALPNREVLAIRAPGGTEIGSKIRQLLLEGNTSMTAEAELLLFMASHVQCLKEVILPALERGAVVLTDRFLESAQAYQGYGRGLNHEVRVCLSAFFDDFEADHTIYIDAPLELCQARIASRGQADRMDAQDRAFKERVVAGLLELRELRSLEAPHSMSVLSNDEDEARLQQRCEDWVQDWVVAEYSTEEQLRREANTRQNEVISSIIKYVGLGESKQSAGSFNGLSAAPASHCVGRL